MSLTLDPRKTALVLIDLQSGIVAMPLSPYDSAQVVRNGIALGQRFKETGGTIVLVRVAFDPSFVDAPPQAVDAPMAARAGGVPADWSTFPPAVEALKADVVITKRNWGAFHGTELDLQLRRRGITTIVVGGIATNFGVESTAREGWQHNYAVVIAEDASSSTAPDLHRFSIDKILPRISRVRSTADILSALSPH